MAFISIFFLGFLLFPISLCYAFIPLILTVLNVVLKVAAMVLLIANGIFLGLLLLGQRFLRNRGFLEDSFINQYGDWRSIALRVLRTLLKVLTVWEAIMVALFTILWFVL